MQEVIKISDQPMGLSGQDVVKGLEEALMPLRGKLKKVLLLPPDYTRVYSGVGQVTASCYRLLKGFCTVHVMPALGTHEAMTPAEILDMFEGAVDPGEIIYHNWRTDVRKIGEVPSDVAATISQGLFSEPIDVEVNARLLDPSYDLIISLGQVVPHEVAGMSNYSKNIFVGCGGYNMISKTHLLSAAWGVKRVLGQTDSPVRAVFDYAQEHFASHLPLLFVLAVSAPHEQRNRLRGLYIGGQDRSLFTRAAEQSARLNINYLDRPVKKVVAYMDEKEFKSVWVGNKAIYRTCMLLAPGGELLIIAPGIRKFGEDMQNDALIRRFGYQGTQKTMELMHREPALAANESVAAHLMQGSSDGQFTVTYAAGHLSRKDVEGVGYRYMSLKEAMERYVPGDLSDGCYQTEDGESYYFAGHPAAGLWMARNRQQ